VFRRWLFAAGSHGGASERGRVGEADVDFDFVGLPRDRIEDFAGGLAGDWDKGRG